jgi:putative transposase
MKKKRFSVEQIIGLLKQAQMGVPVAEVIRKAGLSEQTFYRWKSKYGGLEVDQVRQMAQLQEENQRLKRLVADLTLDKTMLQDDLKKNGEAFGPWADGGSWSGCTGWESGGHVACCVSRERPIDTGAAWIHEQSFGCVSGRSHSQECSTDTARSAFC